MDVPRLWLCSDFRCLLWNCHLHKVGTKTSALGATFPSRLVCVPTISGSLGPRHDRQAGYMDVFVFHQDHTPNECRATTNKNPWSSRLWGWKEQQSSALHPRFHEESVCRCADPFWKQCVLDLSVVFSLLSGLPEHAVSIDKSTIVAIPKSCSGLVMATYNFSNSSIPDIRYVHDSCLPVLAFSRNITSQGSA